MDQNNYFQNLVQARTKSKLSTIKVGNNVCKRIGKWWLMFKQFEIKVLRSISQILIKNALFYPIQTIGVRFVEPRADVPLQIEVLSSKQLVYGALNQEWCSLAN